MKDRTLIIVKPDCVAKAWTSILHAFEAEGFRVLQLKRVWLTRERAEQFYSEHRGKPFFNQLVDFMTSGPCIVAAMAAPAAVKRARELIGATNPAEAKEGTLRHSFGTNHTKNAVHASDSEESAAREIAFFFAESELISE